MRCLTLANELKELGCEVSFVCRNLLGNLNDLIRKKGFHILELPAPTKEINENINETSPRGEYAKWLGVTQDQDALETREVLNNRNAKWMVVDHYGIDATWETQIRSQVNNIMVIDDLADRPHDCDLLLDQNFFIDKKKRYDQWTTPTCAKLLGPEYALLRNEFAETRKKLKPPSNEVRRIFVFFGGTDPDDMTSKALIALSQLGLTFLEVDVVIGETNPNRIKIFELVKNRPRTALHIQVDNMAELMLNSDMALGAGGVTTWERLCLKLPSLVVTVAQNQSHFTQVLHENRIQHWIGDSKKINVDKISREIINAISAPGFYRHWNSSYCKKVDGLGVKKVAKVLVKGPSISQLNIRKAKLEDCDIFWFWANDQVVRKNSYNAEKISINEHLDWYNKKINDRNCNLFIAECPFGPIGQVRFDKINGRFRIDYSVSKQFRGVGIGPVLLNKSFSLIECPRPFFVFGEVKKDNYSSIKVFQKLGFTETVIQKMGAEICVFEKYLS